MEESRNPSTLEQRWIEEESLLREEIALLSDKLAFYEGPDIRLVRYRCSYDDVEFFMKASRDVVRCPRCGNNFAYADADVYVTAREVPYSLADFLSKNPDKKGKTEDIL